MLVAIASAALVVCAALAVAASVWLRVGGAVRPSEFISIVVFSEGGNYGGTFLPILQAFSDRGCKVVYLTCDRADPALALRSDFCDARYLGRGLIAYSRLQFVKARLMLSTTPNIGAPGFPLRRPRGVQELVHVCHAVSGLGNYRRFSLDAYDTVLMPGSFMEREIRAIEKLRNLPAKQCVAVGLPYLDDLSFKTVTKTSVSLPPVILVAPSWGAKNFLRYVDDSVLIALSKAGYEIILRPHPQSWISEPSLIHRVVSLFANCAQFSLDRAVDGSSSMQRADLLVSGRSAIRFDFAFLYNRPVLSVAIPFESENEFEFADLGKTWEDDAERELGPVIATATSPGSFLTAVSEALAFTPQNIHQLRDATVAHFGDSARHVADWCIRATLNVATTPNDRA